jgi:hypothetical protein
MIIFNFIGLLFVAIAFGVAYVVSGSALGEWHGDNALSYYLLGTLTLGLDLAYRKFRSNDQSSSQFFRPSEGGHLFFIPVWMIGALWIILGAIDLAKDGPRIRADNDAFMQETITVLEKSVATLKDAVGNDPAAQPDDLLHRGVARIRELADFYETLDQYEKRRLDRKFGERVSRLIEQIRLRKIR